MKKVLVIDDEQEILSVLDFRLSSWGYETVSALSGVEGLKIAADQRPDLVLLDVMMPGMDGFEVLKQLKGSEKTRDIPVIMLTVISAKKEIERGIAGGASFYLIKPYDVQELQQKIYHLIGEGEK